MKKKSSIILFLIITHFVIGQNIPCKIIFNNGDEFDGLSKITKKEKILFRIDKNDSPDEYGPDEIAKIIFYERNENRVFEYINIREMPKKKKFLLMEIIENGKIIFLQHYKTKKEFNQTGGFWNNGQNFPDAGGYWEKVYIVNKYLKVENSDVAISLNDPETIKSILVKYFSDCPIVLEELEIIGAEDRFIEDLVWQYNRDCSFKKNE